MAAEDDVEVKMRVVLDDEDVKRNVAEAERKMNAKGGPPPIPGGGASGPAASYREMAAAIAKAFKEQRVDSLGAGMNALGEAAAPLASVFFGVRLLQELQDAIMGVIRSLMSLAASLSRYTPELAVAFRGMSVEMRKLSIDMGKTLGTALADLVRALTEITRILYHDLKPLLVLLAAELRLIVGRISYVTAAIRSLSMAAMAAVWALAKFAEHIIELARPLVGDAVADLIGGAAKKLSSAAEAWIKAVQGDGRPESLLNQLLIKGLTEAADRPWQAPTPAGGSGRTVRLAPGGKEPKPERNPDGSPTAVAGRTAIAPVAPRLASIVTNVKNTTEVRLESEQAVTRAMEEVRRALTSAIMRVRNDQLLFANRLANETVVDLVA
jgi:hypothetical protein